jgi:hypothetical protein
MDLYRILATPVVSQERQQAGAANDGDSKPKPWTTETRSIETTDESGLMPAFGCVAP